MRKIAHIRIISADSRLPGQNPWFSLNYAAFEAGFVTKQNLYRVVFMSQGQVYEIYAREVSHGDLFGFVSVEQLVFGERSTVVVDPGEEKIKSEFAHVKRTYLPMHSVIRIDVVDKQGASKISKLEGNVAQFPVPIYTTRDSNN